MGEIPTVLFGALAARQRSLEACSAVPETLDERRGQRRIRSNVRGLGREQAERLEAALVDPITFGGRERLGPHAQLLEEAEFVGNGGVGQRDPTAVSRRSEPQLLCSSRTAGMSCDPATAQRPRTVTIVVGQWITVAPAGVLLVHSGGTSR